MQRILFVVAFAFVAIAIQSIATAGELSRGPYLQQATTDSVVVVWRTQGASTPILRYGSSPDALDHEVSGDAVTLRVSGDVDAPAGTHRLYVEPAEDATKRKAGSEGPNAPADTYQFEAPVAGLQAATKYFYAIYDGETRLAGGEADYYFVTHPPLGSTAAMRLWVVGDSGTGDQNQAMVHDAMQAYNLETKRALDHYIHVGDMAYGDGTDNQFQEHFFDPYKETLRNTVCWPSLGNHEGHTSRGMLGTGPYFDAYVVPTAAEVGGVASGTEAYFSFDIADVHFICLDSHDLDRGTNSAMAQWLRADLEKADAKWLIAYWHHPPYTKGSHDSDTEIELIEMRENFMPILESAGVDFVLTGHSHIYERSMLIDGAYATPTTADGVVLDDGDGSPDGDGAYHKSEGLHPNEGSVNIVAGHGGAGVSRRGTMPIMREIIVEHGSVILDIDGDTAKGIMLNKDGVTRDIFSIVKQGSVTPERIEKPWQPANDLALITRHSLSFAKAEPGSIPENWSVVYGDPNKVGVAANEDGKAQFLSANAENGAIVGLFTPLNISNFLFESYFRLPVAGGSAGVVFSCVDEQNYGRVVVDGKANTIQAVLVVDGKETVLGEQSATIEPGKWLKLSLMSTDGTIEFRFEDSVKFSAEPEKGVPQGRLGFLAPEGGTTEFLNFQIRL